jgi:hypothetical protein
MHVFYTTNFQDFTGQVEPISVHFWSLRIGIIVGNYNEWVWHSHLWHDTDIELLKYSMHIKAADGRECGRDTPQAGLSLKIKTV